MRILLTDPIMSRFADELSADGHDWVVLDEAPDEEIVRLLPDADVLVASRVTAEMAAAATRLRLVHCTGAGVDRIALDALAPGVPVCHTFHHGQSIAEHVVMVALMLSRRVRYADRMMRDGIWVSAAVDPDVHLGHTLAGRTVGVVGLGEIGTRVVRALTMLGMRARAVRRDPDAPVPADVRLERVDGMDRLGDLLAGSDIVVLTVPLTDETRGLIGARELANMRRDAMLINVARGPLVDEHALFDALAGGRLGGAALDVWWSRPTDPGAPSGYTERFDLLDNVVLTPHHSGHTRETFGARAHEIAANVARLSTGDPLTGVVVRGTAVR